MSIKCWSEWVEKRNRLRSRDIQSLLDGTHLHENGILQLSDNWGGSERYEIALAMYGRLPEYRNEQKVLDLRWIPLSHLTVSGFSVLEELYLHDNGLSEIPESISQLRRLRVLSLGRNQISQLPRSLVTMWLCFRRLILGENQIAELPFEEEEMLIEHGSIGSNPLKEPVGTRWMSRNSVADAVSKIRTLLTPIPGCAKDIASIQIERVIALCRQLEEPTIYERLFEGYTLSEGILQHPNRRNPWEREALELLRTGLPREVMLAPSFFG
ncbi:MAG: leucine-rich repeat domain-containing protein [Myxococcota bacterium]|nr:leucine-rich repeat domain-containing protein [Myxococcota bacterium]